MIADTCANDVPGHVEGPFGHHTDHRNQPGYMVLLSAVWPVAVLMSPALHRQYSGQTHTSPPALPSPGLAL